MTPHAIITPMFGLMLLTLIVWLSVLKRRLEHGVRARLSMKSWQNRAVLAQTNLPSSVIQPSDNLMNLFELPVIFYVLCLIMMITNSETPLMVSLAWVYVVLRALHSFIHCTYNKIMHRFSIYVASSVVLWAMAILMCVNLYF